jgi:hypothetical protein
MEAIKLFCLLILTVTSCREDYYDSRLVFINKSDSSIYVINSDFYKDTTFVYVNYYPGNAPHKFKIQPHETKSPIKPIGSWERVYEEQDTIAFYVFDAQVLETTPWDSIKTKYLVLKRFDLTFADLESLDWTITYP